MKYLICAVLFMFYMSSASAANLNITLDGCLLDARDDANVTLFAQIDACTEGFLNGCTCAVPVCLKIAKIIINAIIDSGVQCVRNLPLTGVTTAKINTVIAELDVLVNGWIDEAEVNCFQSASSVEGAISCFRAQVSDCAQNAIDFVKYRATVLGVTA